MVYSNQNERKQWERLLGMFPSRDRTVVSYTNSNDDRAANIQAAIDDVITTGATKKRWVVNIGPGIFNIGSVLTIADVLAAVALTRGQLVLEGAGNGNTIIRGISGSAKMLRITSGKVLITEVTFDSDLVNRSKTIGTGNCIEVDNSDGINAAAVTIANVNFGNIEIFNQPGIGILGRGVENCKWQSINCSLVGGIACHLDGTNFGSSVQGIGNIVEGFRAYLCGAEAIKNELMVGNKFIAPQALLCGGAQHFYDTGINTSWEDVDCEGDGAPGGANGTNNLYGMNLGGTNPKVDGLLCHGYRTAAINMAMIRGPARLRRLRVNNASELNGTYPATLPGYVMTQAVRFGSVVDGHEIDLQLESSEVPSVCGVAAPFSAITGGNHKLTVNGRTWPSNDAVYETSFVGAVVPDYFAKFNGSDATAPAVLSGGAGGILRLTAGNNAGGTVAQNGSQVYGGLNFIPATNGPGRIYAKWELTAITTVKIFIGFTDRIDALEFPITLSGTTFTAVADDACGILFDTEATTDTIRLVGVKATVLATSQDLSVAPVAATAEDIMIDVSAAGAMTVWRNGAIVGTAMANAVSTSVALAPTIIISDPSASIRSLDVRRFRFDARLG